MRRFLIGFLVGSLAAQPLAAQIHTYPLPGFMLPTRYQRPGADCAIFPAAAAIDAPAGFVSPGRFTPTTQQVDSAEHALTQLDLSRINATPEAASYEAYPDLIKKQLAQYKRQYFGFYNPADHPTLYISFALVGADSEWLWLQNRYIVYDAGPGYWTVQYDLTTKTFYAFAHGGSGY